MGHRPTKALVFGCIAGAQEGGIASALDSMQEYSRLKYMPLRQV